MVNFNKVKKKLHCLFIFILYILIIADVICTGIYLTLKGTNFAYVLGKPSFNVLGKPSFKRVGPTLSSMYTN